MPGLHKRLQIRVLDFTEIDQCKPVLLGLSLAGNLVKPLLSLYGTEWRERGYGLWLMVEWEEGTIYCTVQPLIKLPDLFASLTS